MSTFAERLIGSARLDAATYEEVEADTQGTGQALVVVVLSSIAEGLASSSLGVRGLVAGSIGALIGWAAWAVLIYFIGTRVLPEPQTRADPGELLRTTGFASAPGLLRVAGIVPGLGSITFVVTAIWMLAAMVVAVRQALDYSSTGRALGVCAIGWLVSICIAVLIGLMSGASVY